MAEGSQRFREVKAAHAVRKAIQKIRLATPETFDGLEAEAFDVVAANFEDLGSLHDTVVDELGKSLEVASIRIQQLKANREKEAEKDAQVSERPKELLQELHDLLEALEASSAAAEAAAGLGPAPAPTDVEEATALRLALEKDARSFSARCVILAAEVRSLAAPDVVQEWKQLAMRIVEAKKRAASVAASSRLAISKAATSQRKQQVEQRKDEVEQLVRNAAESVAEVEPLIREPESEADIFIRGKRKPEQEMLALAESIESQLEDAKRTLARVQGELRDQMTFDAEEEEAVKKELEVYAKRELRRPVARLAVFDRRLKRVSNIVRRYRQDLKRIQTLQRFESLKADLLAKVKSSDWSASLTEIQPHLLAAEQAVLPTITRSKLSIEEMQDIEDHATNVLADLDAEFAKTKQAICPIDEDMDEDLKLELRAAVAGEMRKPSLQLGLLERRIRRVRNLLKLFRRDMLAKRTSTSKEAIHSLRRLAKEWMSNRGGEDPKMLFAEASPDGADIDEDTFTTLCEGLGGKVRKENAPDEEETLPVSQDDSRAVFAAKLPKGKDKMNHDVFVRCMFQLLTVMKPTTLTSDLNLSDGKTKRTLKVGEQLLVLQGPVKEKRSTVRRVRARSVTDGTVGWVSMEGSAGTVFLKEVE